MGSLRIMEVLIHVPGDREVVIANIDSLGLKKKDIQGATWIKNTLIYLDKYGSYGNRLCLYSEWAKEYEHQPIKNNLGWGDEYMSASDQTQIFNSLKRAIIRNRKTYYTEIEQKIRREKKQRDSIVAKIHELIDFEREVVRKEHKLEMQIVETNNFLLATQHDFPRATFSQGLQHNVDHGLIHTQLMQLGDILGYLREQEIEAVHILKDGKSQIEIDKNGQRQMSQKSNLKKLSTKLDLFVREIKYFIRVWIRNLQITTPMRAHLRTNYAKIYETYLWYAKLFKKESRK